MTFPKNHLTTIQLPQLVEQLHQSLGIQSKQDIQFAARYLKELKKTIGTRSNSNIQTANRVPLGRPQDLPQTTNHKPIPLGDDCAAIWHDDRYLLLAAEGILPSLVEAEPWFAGWCAVMVNVSDIYAMGGHPIAVVDTLWAPSTGESQDLWAGMQAAATAYQVPIVGGHTNCHSPYTALSVAILGQTRHLISSFDAQPGDVLLMVVDLRGQLFKHYPFWNAATDADPQRLRADLAVLPQIATQGWCNAGKDISMGGVLGTVLMLLETSRCGAVIELEAIPRPAALELSVWLHQFPSYGFVLSVRPSLFQRIQAQFQGRGLSCAAIGTVNDNQKLTLTLGTERAVFWDLVSQPLMGWACPDSKAI